MLDFLFKRRLNICILHIIRFEFMSQTSKKTSRNILSFSRNFSGISRNSSTLFLSHLYFRLSALSPLASAVELGGERGASTPRAIFHVARFALVALIPFSIRKYRGTAPDDVADFLYKSLARYDRVPGASRGIHSFNFTRDFYAAKRRDFAAMKQITSR